MLGINGLTSWPQLVPGFIVDGPGGIRSAFAAGLHDLMIVTGVVTLAGAVSAVPLIRPEHAPVRPPTRPGRLMRAAEGRLMPHEQHAGNSPVRSQRPPTVWLWQPHGSKRVVVTATRLAGQGPAVT